jgi:hypothetical protein
VGPGARAPILRRYLELAPGARSHIPVDRRAPLSEFESIASRYPVFRIRARSPDGGPAVDASRRAPSPGSSGRDGAYLVGVVGASLGIAAGIIQWTFGNEIPEWTGNKLHPVQLGIITVALSLTAMAVVVFAHRSPTISARALIGLAAAILAAAVICFTTVGRLWYVPGPLLILAAGLLLAGSRAERGRPTH